MSKNKFIYIMVATTLISLIGVIHFSLNHERAQGELEQKENKIEVLQEENASLHDDVWILNQHLTK